MKLFIIEYALEESIIFAFHIINIGMCDTTCILIKFHCGCAMRQDTTCCYDVLLLQYYNIGMSKTVIVPRG